jgi:hypothetical protein
MTIFSLIILGEKDVVFRIDHVNWGFGGALAFPVLTAPISLEGRFEEDQGAGVGLLLAIRWCRGVGYVLSFLIAFVIIIPVPIATWKRLCEIEMGMFA